MRLSGTDASVTILTLLLSAGLLYFYVQDTRRVTVRSDEPSLGTIVFKKLNATRRASNALVWERMRNNSPVYERDTLRTASASEASVLFKDGTSLDMDENSMLRLSFAGKERRVEFLGGSIAVSGRGTAAAAGRAGPATGGRAAAEANGVYTISAGDRTIRVASGSAASLTRSGNTLSVAVAAGEVAVGKSDGSVETLDPTKELEVGLETGRTRVIEHPIVALLPEQNARLLLERPGSAEIEFTWDAKDDRDGTLELAENREFAPVSISRTATGQSARATVPPGSWYWRVRAPGGATSAARRFTLYAELPPQPILPARGAQVFYRKRLPQIHFSWTAMPDATAYLFEVASDPQFSQPAVRTRTNLESLTVGTLGEGRWYWRVLPLCAMTRIEKASPPEVRSLSVQPRPGMTAPTPTAPLPGAQFPVEEAAAKGVSFSWVPESEAAEYELSVSPSRQMTDAVVTRSSTRPWVTLTGVDAAAFARAGDWYWAVRWKDAEGNSSPYSKARLLVGSDHPLTTRLVFPPDGYTIASSLVTSTRFTWKSSGPAGTVFQLSRDETFSSIAWEEQCDEGTLIGRKWEAGRWYWRIATSGAGGSPLAATPARMFDIVDPLPAARILAPRPDSSFSLPAGNDYTFSWDPVAGADYYQFRLYAVSAGGAEEERYSTSLEATSLSLPLGGYPQGEYRLVLQAFARDKAGSTRLFGYQSRREFSLRSIAHIALPAPGHLVPSSGTGFGPPDFRARSSIHFAWDEVAGATQYLFALYRDADPAPILSPPPLSENSYSLMDLSILDRGEYRWTVRARVVGRQGGVEQDGEIAESRFSIYLPPLRAPALKQKERFYGR